MKGKNKLITADKALIHDVRRMIEETRASVAVEANTGLTLLHWRIGRRITQEVLKESWWNMANELLPRCRKNYPKATVLVQLFHFNPNDQIL